MPCSQNDVFCPQQLMPIVVISVLMNTHTVMCLVLTADVDRGELCPDEHPHSDVFSPQQLMAIVMNSVLMNTFRGMCFVLNS